MAVLQNAAKENKRKQNKTKQNINRTKTKQKQNKTKKTEKSVIRILYVNQFKIGFLFKNSNIKDAFEAYYIR